MTQSRDFLRGRALQILEDQIRHGLLTRQSYHVPGGARRGVPPAASAAVARQDRIRLRALCAGLRALRQDPEMMPCVSCRLAIAIRKPARPYRGATTG